MMTDNERPTNMIKLDYTLYKDDYKRMLQEINKHQKRGILTVILLLIITLAVFTSTQVLGIEKETQTRVISIVGGMFAGGCVGLLLVLAAQKQLTITTVESDGFVAHIEAEITEETLTFVNRFCETKFYWNSFTECKETTEHFILTQASNKNCYTLLPKRGFSSSADLEEFRLLARTHIGAVPLLSNSKQVARKSQGYIIYVLLLIAIAVMIFSQFRQYH